MVGALHGKVALVTGAATGIGRATALALAEAGANVIVHYATSEEDASLVVRHVKDLGRQAVALQADFAERGAAATLAEQAENHWGHVDILVNNAGWSEPARDPRTDPAADLGAHAEHWDRALDVNLRAPFELTWRLARAMRERRSGCIVNVASTSGYFALVDTPLYSLAKAGLLHLTRQAALVYAPHVRVNAVAPGWTRTGFAGGRILDPELQRELATEIPLRRLGDPEEVAEAILFLVKGPSYVTGTTLTLDGGDAAEAR
ncbi:MAG TPA: SDR family oxidoreductase [Candidatus Thermoplasmatota archaeon]|nr:SDR family oxidoreductase [Candidatus Thermoplasmatota archaeon]